MRTVCKMTLGEFVNGLLPYDAVPMTALVQDGAISVWYHVDARISALPSRRVHVLTCPATVPARTEYFCSVQEAHWVGHLFVEQAGAS